MNENERTRNQTTLDGKVNATREYVYLYLHSWNDARINYYMHALVISALIFNYNKQSFNRMVNFLNNRLEQPLTYEEQIDTLKILKSRLREELL